MRDALFFYVLNVDIVLMGNVAAPDCTNPLCTEKMIRAYVRIGEGLPLITGCAPDVEMLLG